MGILYCDPFSIIVVVYFSITNFTYIISFCCIFKNKESSLFSHTFKFFCFYIINIEWSDAFCPSTPIPLPPET